MAIKFNYSYLQPGKKGERFFLVQIEETFQIIGPLIASSIQWTPETGAAHL